MKLSSEIMGWGVAFCSSIALGSVMLCNIDLWWDNVKLKSELALVHSQSNQPVYRR